MKKVSQSLSGRAARAAVTSIFLVVSLCLLAISSTTAGLRKGGTVSAQQPSQPNLTPTTFTGTFDPHVYPCSSQVHDFTVPANQARITVEVNAHVPTNDITVTLLS